MADLFYSTFLHPGTIAVERSVHDILNPGTGPSSAGAASSKASLPNGIHKPSKPAPASAKAKSGKAAGWGKAASAAAVDPAQKMREQQLAEESQACPVTCTLTSSHAHQLIAHLIAFACEASSLLQISLMGDMSQL